MSDEERAILAEIRDTDLALTAEWAKAHILAGHEIHVEYVEVVKDLPGVQEGKGYLSGIAW